MGKLPVLGPRAGCAAGPRPSTDLSVPDDYAVCAMFAVGRPGDPAQLPAELREREVPSPRKPVREIIREGKWFF